MSTFANVYIGSTPNDGTGDLLRNAFDKINHNFSNIAGGSSGTVTSVAGRTGDVVLAVNDVKGAASNVYARSYTMSNSANWNDEVNTVGTALDQLAQRLRDAGF